MQASISTRQRLNGKNLDTAKERTLTLKAVAPISLAHPAPTVYAEAWFWMSRSRTAASTVYCSVWVHGTTYGISGHGKATGGGYHKESTALARALQSAGITLPGDIRATDTDAMADALRTVAIAAGAPADHVAIL